VRHDYSALESSALASAIVCRAADDGRPEPRRLGHGRSKVVLVALRRLSGSSKGAVFLYQPPRVADRVCAWGGVA